MLCLWQTKRLSHNNASQGMYEMIDGIIIWCPICRKRLSENSDVETIKDKLNVCSRCDCAFVFAVVKRYEK